MGFLDYKELEREVLKELKLGIPNSQTVKAFPCKRPLYLSHKVALCCELAVVVFLHLMIQTFFIHWTIHQELELTYLLLNPGFTKSDLVELVIVARHFRYLWLLNNHRWRPPVDLWLRSLTSIYGSHETEESRPMPLFSSCFKKVAFIKNTKNSWMSQTWQVSTWLLVKRVWVAVNRSVLQALGACKIQPDLWKRGLDWGGSLCTTGSACFVPAEQHRMKSLNGVFHFRELEILE